MRVLLIHQYFLEDHEGGGSRWNEMSRIWTEAGHEITVLAGMGHYMDLKSRPYPEKYFEKKMNMDGVFVIRCFVPSYKSTSFKKRILAFLTFTFSSIWAGIFHAREKYNVIIVTSPPIFLGITALLLSVIKRVPFVFEVRDLWPESAIEMGFLKNRFLISLACWFEKYLYGKAKMITVLTPAFREILVDTKSVDPNKIILIPNGADFRYSDEVLDNLDVKTFRTQNDLDNRFIVTYVGAHGPANHLLQILETAEILRNTNVCFLLIGEGACKKSLMMEARKLNLTNVKFIDFCPREEAFKYIIASDMGTSVLKKTGIFKTVYSNKTFDYFSCKKPILMAIDGISRTLVEDANAGVFVDPENPKDFADKILQCMNKPENLRKQGENGYIYAKTHFDREVLARKYLQALIEMMGIERMRYTI